MRETGGTRWKEWSDLIWMYRALSDPRDAVRLFEASRDAIAYEAGNSKANAYAWIYSLNELGSVDAGVSADTPLYAVFRKGKTKTYCVHAMTDEPRTVQFSDGFQLKVPGKGFTSAQAPK